MPRGRQAKVEQLFLDAQAPVIHFEDIAAEVFAGFGVLGNPRLSNDAIEDVLDQSQVVRS